MHYKNFNGHGLKKFARDKRSSLFCSFIMVELKSFIPVTSGLHVDLRGGGFRRRDGDQHRGGDGHRPDRRVVVGNRTERDVDLQRNQRLHPQHDLLRQPGVSPNTTFFFVANEKA
jgi:hypothetical protein